MNPARHTRNFRSHTQMVDSKHSLQTAYAEPKLLSIIPLAPCIRTHMSNS